VTRISVAFFCWLALAGTPRTARADSDPEALAAESYERATELVKQGNNHDAAYLFAKADTLVPSAVALEEALTAALAADDAALSMALAKRAESRVGTPRLAELRQRATTRFARVTGRIVVPCTDNQCAATIDGEDAGPPADGWVAVGRHRVSFVESGKTKIREVDVAPGAEVRVAPDAAPTRKTPPAPRPAPPPRQSGLSPTWFWVGVAATGVLAGVAAASGLDAKSKNDRFLDTGRNDRSLREQGMAAETRTNVLIGAAAVAGVGSAVLGLFAVNWGDREVGAGAVGSQRSFVVRASSRF
jgi:hypothetical protein